LNNSKNKIEGNKNLAKGIIPGRSDFEFFFNGKTYFIEIKTEKGIQEEDQIIFQKNIEKHGFQYFIIRNIEEFIYLHNLITKKNDILI